MPLLSKFRRARVVHTKLNTAEALRGVGVARGSRAASSPTFGVVLANGDFSVPELLLLADDISQATKSSGGSEKSPLAGSL